MVGGDITEITFNHPTLGSGVLFVKSDEDSELDLGGYRSADEEKGIATNGDMIDTMTLSRWMASATLASDLTDANHLKKVTDMASHPLPASWSVSHISGAVYRGNGKPVGDVKQAVKGSTLPLKISGGGKMEKIV